MKSAHSSAFTLVELSIVLVILGLLTGGILTGQSLIRAAELRSITVEYDKYLTATQTFRDKYRALPGDMNNATTFWGISTACTGGDAEGGCNGNQDGIINDPVGFQSPGEAFQFWRHLQRAGLIEGGTYTGVGIGMAHPLGTELGVNAPRSKLSIAGWSAFNRTLAQAPVDVERYILPYGNMFIFGGQSLSNTNEKIITPQEAWNIDTKIDDGKPAKGVVIARYWNNGCGAADDGTHANSDLEASYKLSDSSIQCALHFRNLF